MLIPIGNCEHNFSVVSLKPFLPPSFNISSNFFLPNYPYKPRLRRTSTAAAAVDGEIRAQSQSAIRKIADKLRSLGFVEETSNGTSKDALLAGPGSPGEIFVPLPSSLPKYRVGHTLDPSWSTPENPVPEPGSGNAIQRFHELRLEIMEEKEKERINQCCEGRRKTTPSMAELTLSKEELTRLRSVGIQLKQKLKLGKAGITEGIVNGIHERWRRSEMVKITCEDICRLNMKRTHELLEKRTGGLVIWRSGSNIILYRGPDYKYPYFLADGMQRGSFSEESSVIEEGSTVLHGSSGLNFNVHNKHPPLVQGVGLPNRVRFQLPGEAELAEETNVLLEGLGPRFTDWWDNDPLPIDADLLPGIVHGYKMPFRLLPHGVRPKLTNDELNTLRRLSRPLPCHFALGRNRRLQGLAVSIVKLWEKCEIAKIAVKRGVQNTNSELMAEELKRLTGGILLSRDREFIVFYRGKDFLPASVSSAINERRKHGIEEFKTKVSKLQTSHEDEDTHKTNHCGSSELDGGYHKQKLRISEAEIEKASAKLSVALDKKARAEKLLEELEQKENPQSPEIDKEGITEEERYVLRRVGLRMKPFLLMGRRGIFNGTIENMHLHWKYRELVKVCIGRRNIKEVHHVAQTLVAESGGILVAVEPSRKGYVIIVYRGKNYERPASLRPRNLLSKREAMKHSKEVQRRQSLKLNVLKLNKSIDKLKQRMVQMGNIENLGETSPSDNESNFTPHEARESHGTDATNFIEPQDPMGHPNGDMHIIQGLLDTSEVELQERLRNPETMQNQTSLKTDCYRGIESEPSTQNAVNEGLSLMMMMPLKSSHLSNRERLLLRKQALSVRRPHVLAVGKGNVINGVAKAIKEHFKKHPFAIVNIKGRDEKTSIQEVIYNLVQATGAVLVSQEPSKVILYRGWGREAEKDSKNHSSVEKVKPARVMSPELVRAIRLECGLEYASESVATNVMTSD